MRLNRTAVGYILGAVAAACYGMNPFFALHLYAGGLNVDSVLFFRYVLSAILLGAFMLIPKIGANTDQTSRKDAIGEQAKRCKLLDSFKIGKKEFLPLVMMGILFLLSSIFLFSSYEYMDAGIASTILFVYPIMVAMINSIFFKEKVSLITVCFILIASLGIALLYKDGGGKPLNLFGVVLVLLSSLSYAIYMIAVNKSSLGKMPAIKLTFYALSFGVVFLLIKIYFFSQLIFPNSLILWINILGIAIIPTIISLLFMSFAIRIIGSTYTAILGALEPITAVIIGFFVFNEIINGRIVLGIFLILVSVTLIIFDRQLYAIIDRKFLSKLK